MCLITHGKPKFRKSLFRHTYYKVLTERGGRLYTPFQACYIILDTKYEIMDDTKTEFSPWIYDEWKVYGGCFHLYCKKYDAKREAEYLSMRDGQKYKVFKAVVPAGTRCAKGMFGSNEAIAVRRVIYQEL